MKQTKKPRNRPIGVGNKLMVAKGKGSMEIGIIKKIKKEKINLKRQKVS